jgi:hypothetical protein
MPWLLSKDIEIIIRESRWWICLARDDKRVEESNYFVKKLSWVRIVLILT